MFVCLLVFIHTRVCQVTLLYFFAGVGCIDDDDNDDAVRVRVCVCACVSVCAHTPEITTGTAGRPIGSQ